MWYYEQEQEKPRRYVILFRPAGYDRESLEWKSTFHLPFYLICAHESCDVGSLCYICICPYHTRVVNFCRSKRKPPAYESSFSWIKAKMVSEVNKCNRLNFLRALQGQWNLMPAHWYNSICRIRAARVISKVGNWSALIVSISRLSPGVIKTLREESLLRNRQLEVHLMIITLSSAFHPNFCSCLRDSQFTRTLSQQLVVCQWVKCQEYVWSA